MDRLQILVEFVKNCIDRTGKQKLVLMRVKHDLANADNQNFQPSKKTECPTPLCGLCSFDPKKSSAILIR